MCIRDRSIFKHFLTRLYNAKTVENILSKSIVLSPPIDNKLFKAPIKKENIIVMKVKGGRELKVLGDIVARIAEKYRDWSIYVIGYLDQRLSQKVREYIGGQRERLVVLPNLSEEKKINLLSKAKIYIHPVKYEHFGIIIGEALALGCRVLVHRFSGIIYDIVSYYGRDSLKHVRKCIATYNDYSDIAEALQVMEDIEDYNPSLCRELVKPFQEHVFKHKVKTLMRNFIEGV